MLGVASAQHHPVSELLSKLESDMIARNLQQDIGPLLDTKFCDWDWLLKEDLTFLPVPPKDHRELK